MDNSPEIAVFLGKNGHTTRFYGEGSIVIFQQGKGDWTAIREKTFALKQVHGMSDFKQIMEEILTFMDTCRVLVGLSITGVPFYFLSKAKCSVWECEGNPQDFLDYVQSQEEISAAKKCKRSSSEEKKPKDIAFNETSPGNYFVSIKEIQEKNVQLTSKQVLLPFIRKGEFKSLEIICNHIPGWLEEEVLRLKLNLQITDTGRNQVKVVLKSEGLEHE